jgi:hypothetical protein
VGKMGSAHTIFVRRYEDKRLHRKIKRKGEDNIEMGVKGMGVCVRGLD